MQPYSSNDINTKITRKLSYRKDDRAMRAIYGTLWVPWKFSTLPEYAHGY